MYYIKKRIEISGSHRLELPYESKCTRSHGHNWILTVHCRSAVLTPEGMVTDFTHIKQQLTETLDHQHFNDVLPFSEWGNPPQAIAAPRRARGEPGELKHLITRRRRKQ